MKILEIQDVSTPRVKRYSAVVVADTNDEVSIRKIVTETVQQVKNAEVYRTETMRKRWADMPAQVVWLYVAESEADARRSKWVCRIQWIDPDLKEYRPVEMEGHERHDGMILRWIVGENP